MLHCQLPRAFRRLARPSSPVIAKASTTCTYVLDPITLHPSCIKYLVRATLCRWFTGRARRCRCKCNHSHISLAANALLYLCLPVCQRTSSRKTQETLSFPQPSRCTLLVELIGFEPTTPGLQSRCSPSLATAPRVWWVWLVSNPRVFRTRVFL